MKDEEDMLELLDDEGKAEQFDLELDEPDEELTPGPEEKIPPIEGDTEALEEPDEESGEGELEIDIRIILIAVVAIAAILIAGVFVLLPMLSSAPPEVTITPSQSGEDIFLYLEKGPSIPIQEMKLTLNGAVIPADKLMLMGGAAWPWSEGTVLKVDTSGYAKPGSLAVISTKGDSEYLLFSTHADPTPTPTPTPTPVPTPEPIIEPVQIMQLPGTQPESQPMMPISTQVIDHGQSMFEAVPSSGVQPLTVRFSDMTIVCALNRTWHFGDGLASSMRYADHTYPFPGTYTATLDLIFCDPDERMASPDREITVLPMERQDTLLSGPGSATVLEGGVIFFTVKGPGTSLRIGGRDHYLEKGDHVRIDLNKGGAGYISIISNAILQCNFNPVTVTVNDNKLETGWLTNINIDQYDQIATTDLSIQVRTREPGLRGLVDGAPAIIAGPGQVVTLHNVGVDSTGKLLYSIQDQAGFSFRGGIESFEVTNPLPL